MLDRPDDLPGGVYHVLGEVRRLLGLMRGLGILPLDFLLLYPLGEGIFAPQLRVVLEGGLPCQLDIFLCRPLLRLAQGAVGLGAAAVSLPAQDAAHTLFHEQFAFVGGLQRHIVTLRFMDFAVELHHRRCFRHATGAGGQRGLAVLRQNLLLKVETAAGPARLAVRFRLEGQAVLGGKMLPRLLHLTLRTFHPAHGLLIVPAGWRGVLLRRRGGGAVRRRGRFLKLQPWPVRLASSGVGSELCRLPLLICPIIRRGGW